MRGSTGFVKPLLFILIALCVVAVVAFVAAGMMGGDRDLGSAVDFTAVDQKGESFTLSKRFGVGGTALIFFDRTSGDAKALIENLSAAKKDTSVCTVLVAKGEKDSKEVEKYLKDASLPALIVLPVSPVAYPQHFWNLPGHQSSSEVLSSQRSPYPHPAH